MRRQDRGFAIGASVITLALAAAPAAYGDDVTVDPGSPPGKEYALPLDSARSQAAPETPPPEGSSEPEPSGALPAFGVGVGEETSASERHESAGSDERAGEKEGAAKGGVEERVEPPTRSFEDVGDADRAVLTSSDSSADLILPAGIAAVLVLVGLAGASVVRRSRSPTP